MRTALPLLLAAGIGLALLLLSPRRAKAAAPPPSPGPVPVDGRPEGEAPTLKLGAAGVWVSYLQKRLGVPASGSFDAATDKAVKALQAQKGLAADGVVGPKTWAAIGVAAVPAPATGTPAAEPKPVSIPAAPPPKVAPGNPFGLAETVPEREAQILKMVKEGKTDHMFVPLTFTKGGHKVTVMVSRRALALQAGDRRLIVSASFKTAQKIADILGAHMLTTAVADEIWKAAPKKLGVLSKPWNTDSPVTGGKLSRMYEQSAHIDQQAGGAAGLVANEGKDWVLTRRFWLPPSGTGVEKPEGATGSRHNSANFGWYGGDSKSPGGAGVIQSVGLAHEKSFVDYSQLLRFMMPAVFVDDKPMTTAKVLSDPKLSSLLNDEGGTLPDTRHPDFLGVA